jgi:predicted DsbA family dithiol-disulfide isomerase
MKIEIWSDIACPWCYIGKRRLERALAARPDAEEVEIIWRSFQLDPSAPPSSEQSLEELLSRKYGMSVEKARQMQQHMAGVAADEGLRFNFDSVQPGNTFDAHRLIHFARTEGRQGEMKERLLRAYFTDGTWVGDHATLAEAAGDVGLDAEQVRQWLPSDRFGAEVRRDQARATELGIRGVPFFLIDGQYGISGAQPPEAFAQIFAELGIRAGEPGVRGDAG